MEEVRKETLKYIVHTSDADYHCKLYKYIRGTYERNNIYFGTKDGFHLFAELNTRDNKVDVKYIEYNDNCINEEKLSYLEKLVKAALWTIKELFPDIEEIRIKATLFINNQKNSRFLLDYDYLFVHNAIWYEKQLGIQRYKHELYDEIKNLDSYLHPLENFLELPVPEIVKYADIYNDIFREFGTLREFVGKLKEKYGDKYYDEVEGWFCKLMRYYRTDTYNEYWFIKTSNLIMPKDYTIKKTKIPMKTLRLRKFNCEFRVFDKMLNYSGQCMGTYGTDEYE